MRQIITRVEAILCARKDMYFGSQAQSDYSIGG
jgi:hypothetical protein